MMNKQDKKYSRKQTICIKKWLPLPASLGCYIESVIPRTQRRAFARYPTLESRQFQSERMMDNRTHVC